MCCAGRSPTRSSCRATPATVAVAAWAAFLGNIEVAHVEAGLRSGNKWHPFPEEVNRRITSVVGDLHFAPTGLAAENLRHEGIENDRIFLTGNTIVDALYTLRERLGDTPPPLGLDRGKPILLVTVHRRENFGEPLRNVCAAVRRIAEMHPDLQIVVPMHPNPAAGAVVQQLLGGIPSIRLCRALPYSEFVKLLLAAKIALSDSGGIQEEGPRARSSGARAARSDRTPRRHRGRIGAPHRHTDRARHRRRA